MSVLVFVVCEELVSRVLCPGRNVSSGAIVRRKDLKDPADGNFLNCFLRANDGKRTKRVTCIERGKGSWCIDRHGEVLQFMMNQCKTKNLFRENARRGFFDQNPSSLIFPGSYSLYAGQELAPDARQWRTGC